MSAIAGRRLSLFPRSLPPRSERHKVLRQSYCNPRTRAKSTRSVTVRHSKFPRPGRAKRESWGRLLAWAVHQVGEKEAIWKVAKGAEKTTRFISETLDFPWQWISATTGAGSAKYGRLIY